MGKEDANLMLSVIVPVYNVEKYIERCLDSILNQTFRDFEVICVDDGSTDGSLDILRRYQQRDKRIKIIHKVNGGLVSARKAGALDAKGVYVACVDSDDWIENNMYEEMVAVARKTDADVVTSGNIRDYGNHCIDDYEQIDAGLYEGANLREKFYANMIATDVFFHSNISIHVWDKLYKRGLLTKYQMLVDDEINIGEDLVCAYPCLLNAGRIAVMGENYYHYCMRNDSIMGINKEYTEKEHQLLCNALYKRGMECVKYVPNIMKQFIVFENYVLLLRDAGKSVRYKKGVLYPFGAIEKDDKIVIYGAGRFGCELKSILEEQFQFNIVAQVDKAKWGGVIYPEELADMEYDKIIIAVLKADIVAQIREELLEKDVDENKIMSVDVRLMEMQYQRQ